MTDQQIDAAASLLEVDGLNVHFAQDGPAVHGLRDVSFNIRAGETVALVGESGSGKSTLGLALMGLLRPPAYVTSGEVRWKGTPMSVNDGRSPTALSMVWQDPAGTFNPRLTIGHQVTEGMRRLRGLPKAAARRRAVELLDHVGIREPQLRMGEYPHQLSGGMLQRVGIAAAIATEPELLIADEPTSALDVTVQAQILNLISSLQKELDLAVLLITHDLAVVSEQCRRINVMYAGRIVETGEVRPVFADPLHPYTSGLLGSMPTLHDTGTDLETIPGGPPDLAAGFPGCCFQPRCRVAIDRCRTGGQPPLFERLDDHGFPRQVACLLQEGAVA